MSAIPLEGRTVGEVAAENPVSIRIFEEWKIDYCCGGHTPLADAVAEAGKSVDEFAAALSRSAVVSDLDTIPWATEPLDAVAARIVEMYHRYTREELQTLIALSAKVHGVHGTRHPELEEVKSIVGKMTVDLWPHMLKEEQVLFPYVDQLAQGQTPTPFFGTVKNPVKMMMTEHDAVGDLLAQLRAITNDYALPHDACFSYRELYRRLDEFEQRTHEHIHVENNIYFPRAVALEEKAGNARADFAHPHAHMCNH